MQGVEGESILPLPSFTHTHTQGGRNERGKEGRGSKGGGGKGEGGRDRTGGAEGLVWITAHGIPCSS